MHPSGGVLRIATAIFVLSAVVFAGAGCEAPSAGRGYEIVGTVVSQDAAQTPLRPRSQIFHGRGYPILIERQGLSLDVDALPRVVGVGGSPVDGAPATIHMPQWAPESLFLSYAYEIVWAKKSRGYRLIYQRAGEKIDETTSIQDVQSSGLILYIDPKERVSAKGPRDYPPGATRLKVHGDFEGYYQVGNDLFPDHLVWWGSSGQVYSLMGNFGKATLRWIADSVR